MSRVCPYCSPPFVASPFSPSQTVCIQAECQRLRRRRLEEVAATAKPDTILGW